MSNEEIINSKFIRYKYEESKHILLNYIDVIIDKYILMIDITTENDKSEENLITLKNLLFDESNLGRSLLWFIQEIENLYITFKRIEFNKEIYDEYELHKKENVTNLNKDLSKFDLFMTYYEKKTIKEHYQYNKSIFFDNANKDSSLFMNKLTTNTNNSVNQNELGDIVKSTKNLNDCNSFKYFNITNNNNCNDFNKSNNNLIENKDHNELNNNNNNNNNALQNNLYINNKYNTITKNQNNEYNINVRKNLLYRPFRTYKQIKDSNINNLATNNLEDIDSSDICKENVLDSDYINELKKYPEVNIRKDIKNKIKLKNLYFEFTKRENIDKTIMRKFRKYLLSRIKKDENTFINNTIEKLPIDCYNNSNLTNKNKNLSDINSEEYINDNFNNNCNKTNYNYEKKEFVTLKMPDFWRKFTIFSYLPPFKKNNIEFKSFCTNYMLWVFAHDGGKRLYDIFLNDCLDSILEMFNGKFNDKQIKELTNYILQISFIFSREENLFRKDFYLKYNLIGNKNIDNSDNLLGDLKLNETVDSNRKFSICSSKNYSSKENCNTGSKHNNSKINIDSNSLANNTTLTNSNLTCKKVPTKFIEYINNYINTKNFCINNLNNTSSFKSLCNFNSNKIQNLSSFNTPNNILFQNINTPNENNIIINNYNIDNLKGFNGFKSDKITPKCVNTKINIYSNDIGKFRHLDANGNCALYEENVLDYSTPNSLNCESITVISKNNNANKNVILNAFKSNLDANKSNNNNLFNKKEDKDNISNYSNSHFSFNNKESLKKDVNNNQNNIKDCNNLLNKSLDLNKSNKLNYKNNSNDLNIEMSKSPNSSNISPFNSTCSKNVELNNTDKQNISMYNYSKLPTMVNNYSHINNFSSTFSNNNKIEDNNNSTNLINMYINNKNNNSKNVYSIMDNMNKIKDKY